jgi:hypothetical protein
VRFALVSAQQRENFAMGPAAGDRIVRTTHQVRMVGREADLSLLRRDLGSSFSVEAGGIGHAIRRPARSRGSLGYYQEGAVSDRDVRQLLARAAHAEGSALTAAS